MSTREERAEEAREWIRTEGHNCIGCHLGICDLSHDEDCEDDE